jgi:hypothetical protein
MPPPADVQYPLQTEAEMLWMGALEIVSPKFESMLLLGACCGTLADVVGENEYDIGLAVLS